MNLTKLEIFFMCVFGLYLGYTVAQKATQRGGDMSHVALEVIGACVGGCCLGWLVGRVVGVLRRR